MAAGAAMTTPDVAKRLAPVVKIWGMKNAIVAIQTLTRPTEAAPSNVPTSKLSECRRLVSGTDPCCAERRLSESGTPARVIR